MSTNTLRDKVAIVTGGGRGLGRAMVYGLVQSGAGVVATAARAEIESLSPDLGEDRVLALLSDVTRPEACATSSTPPTAPRPSASSSS